MNPFLLAFALLLPVATPPNPCTNGSFEELAPNGFPLDWEPVGRTVEVVADAHSGQRALRLVRGEDRLRAELQTAETGLNRAWKAKSGERGAMIDRLKGGIEFWYKALSAAEGAKLTVQAIPMNAVPIEGTDSPRAIFTVPKDHIADGRWHQGRLKYDFTGDPKAKWVHFAARILGTAGDLLLDDFAYVEKVGPILRISRLRLDEDPKRPGERCTISALIENVGDAPAPDTRATLTVPPGLRAIPAELRLGDLCPTAKAVVSWALLGRRTWSVNLDLRATSAAAKAEESLQLAPDLLLESFGPVSPMGIVGRPQEVELIIRNLGHVTVSEPTTDFHVHWANPRSPTRATRQLNDLPPGASCRVRFTHVCQIEGTIAPAGYAGVTVQSPSLEGQPMLHTQADLWAVPLARPPAPSGRLRAIVADDCAVLENERLRLVFPRTAYGFAPAELFARTPMGWRAVGWIRPTRSGGLGFTTDRLKEGGRAWLSTWLYSPRAETRLGPRCSLSFSCTFRHPNGTLHATSCFSLGKEEKSVSVHLSLVHDSGCEVDVFEPPLLLALRRDEAVLPGLEWLVDEEVSSSSLDIAKSHPDRWRTLVHPHTVCVPAIGVHGGSATVGLLWDNREPWAGQRDRPGAIFDSPDRMHRQRSHVAGLIIPGLSPYTKARAWGNWNEYRLEPGRPLAIEYRILVDGEAKDALAAVDEWIRIYGLPEPQPLPKRGDGSNESNESNQSNRSYEHEIQFSMQAYLRSLWVPETKEWWTSKGGGPIMSKKGRPHDFAADLLLGSLVSPDEAARKQCREQALEIAEFMNSDMRLDAMRFPGRFDLAIANPAHAAGLLATMGSDGAWRFDADQEGKGPFVGMDYHELGPDNAAEVGTCANKAFQVLRYARIAGDAAAYERMQKTLRLMETFRVPRAAQVWEVPVHTPDLLAAADAVDAYLEAYRFSGDERWLRDAVTWARRGIPFIYLWNPPDKPWLLGASIPVYGATWFTGSWFGRPVQWNGLRYATALLKLAEYDRSKDWRRLAELIIHSAILQQDSEGENVALWPDNISAIDGTKCPWVFAPRQIIQNILLLNGRDEEPQTTILTHKPFLRSTRRIHISTTAKISDAAWDGDLLTFNAAYPEGEEGCVLITNVAKPIGVALDGKPLAERAEVERGADPGWRYDDALAYLCIRVDLPAVADTTTHPVMLSEAKHLSGEATDATKMNPAGGARSPERFFAPLRFAQNDSGVGLAQNDNGGRSAHHGLKAALRTRAVRIEGARHRRVDRLPRLVDRIDFPFARSAEGWMAAHDIADLAARAGALCGKATANDPYLVRSLIRVKGDACPVLLIRMRSTAGPAAQLFWTTEASSAFDEEKSLHFQVQPDGQWHDYRLDVSKHPQWAGQTITAVRLDPGDAPGEFAVGLIRSEEK
ncbi:MAG: hypothetical protein FJ291_18710 [Planctomycetes bacterium]|nr:hypothetical protein [Planctomycetota bacterium]